MSTMSPTASGAAAVVIDGVGAGHPGERSFYELINDLTLEYDRSRNRSSELCAENARLRQHLQRQADEVAAAKRSASFAKQRLAEQQMLAGELRADRGASLSDRKGSGGDGPGGRGAVGKDCQLEASDSVQHNVIRASLASVSEPIPEPVQPESPRPPPGDHDDHSPIVSSTGGMVMSPPAIDTSFDVNIYGGQVTTIRFRDMDSVCSAPRSPQDLDTPPTRDDPLEPCRISVDSGFSGTESDCVMKQASFSVFHEQGQFELELLPIWTKARKRSHQRRPSSTTSDPTSPQLNAALSPSQSSLSRNLSGLVMEARLRSGSSQELYVGVADTEVRDRSCLERLVLRPTNRKIVMWDILTLLTLCWDLIIIPMQAFELPQSKLWEGMEIFATVIWTMDLILSFFKGYERDGEVEMRPRNIARSYLRTWFIFDISIVGMDWALMVLENGDLVDLLRFSRFRRALRLLRLARLVKHGSKFVALANTIRSEDLVVILRVLWLLVLLIAINHFISCGWYAVGTIGGLDSSWTEHAFKSESDLVYKYVTSFHWSVTQFTPASMEVYPRNSAERAYNIVIIFLGLLMFSSFVSNMTNSMTYLTKRNYERRSQRDMLTSYMNSRGLTHILKSDIATYLSYGAGKNNRRRCMQETDIAAMRMLPESLLERMHIEIFSKVLFSHSFFSFIYIEEANIVEKLCHHAMQERKLAHGEELFRFGVKSARMFFMVTGVGMYILGYGEQAAPVEVVPGQWLCEGCLWVNWTHRGRMNAREPMELAELDSSEFQGILSRSRLLPSIQRYVRLYVSRAEFENNGAEGISDLWGQRLRVMHLAHHAFHPEEVFLMHGAEAAALNKERIFKVWKRRTDLGKALSKPGVINTFRRKWYQLTGRY